LSRQRVLPVHLARRLVLAQPLERRRPQATVVCPLDELDLADELRPHPHHVRLPYLRHLRADRERALLLLERPQLREQLVDHPVREPGADVAGVVELVAAPAPEDEWA